HISYRPSCCSDPFSAVRLFPFTKRAASDVVTLRIQSILFFLLWQQRKTRIVPRLNPVVFSVILSTKIRNENAAGKRQKKRKTWIFVYYSIFWRWPENRASPPRRNPCICPSPPFPRS